MAVEEKVKNALKRGGRKLHTHSVSYSRADNGGLHAKVERHTKEGHHHTEDHVLASKEDAAQHLLDHMSDQPPVGGGAPPEQAEPEGEEAMAGAPGAGGASGPMPPPGMAG